MRQTSRAFWVAWIVPALILLGAGPARGNEKAPGFSLKDVSRGQPDTVTLADLKGKVVLLNIFSTTCDICRAEFKELLAVNNKYAGRDDVRVVGIAMDPMVEPIRSLTRAAGLNYMVLMGELQTLVTWKIKGFPTTFLITNDGEIHKRYEGLQDRSILVSDIERLLPQKKGPDKSD